MKSLTLATVLATAVACLVPVAPAQAAPTPPYDPANPVLNVCAELDLDPCPEGLDRVEATDVVSTAQAGCSVSFSTFGPGIHWVTDPVWGTYSIRYLFIGSGVVCDTREDLTAVAETVPAERTTSDSTLVDQDVCLASKSCWATAGWGHSDLIVGPTPICAYSSATATIDTRAFGPYHPPSSTAGVNCL